MIQQIDDELLLKLNIKEENNPFINYIGYFENNNLLGYLVYNLLYDKIDIVNIFVEEKYRNRKIGTNMLQYLIEKAKEDNIINITLEVNCNNKNAIKLYKKFNFKEVAIRKCYYNNKEDGILMELKL